MSAGTALAAPGEPDPGFGTAGVVTGGLLGTAARWRSIRRAGSPWRARPVGKRRSPLHRGRSAGHGLLRRWPGRTRIDGSRLHVFRRPHDRRRLDVGGWHVPHRSDGSVQHRLLHRQGDGDRRPRRRLRHGRRGHVTAAVHVRPPGCRRRTRRVDHVHDARDRDPGQRFVRRVQRRWCRVRRVQLSDNDTALVPSGCSPMGGYAVRGVVRPTATQEIHVGKAILICGSDSRERVVLTSQTVGTTTINWSVMLPIAETVSPRTRWRSTSSAPTSCSTHGGRCHTRASLHELGRPGQRLGRGRRRHAGVRIRRGRWVQRARQQPGRNRQRSLLHLAVDDGARRSSASNGAVDSTFPRVSTSVGGDLIASDIAGAPDGGVLVTTQTATPAPCAAIRAGRHRRWRR